MPDVRSAHSTASSNELRADPCVVHVRAFGPWRVSVDGAPAAAIKSRYARELLLAFSLNPGPIARDLLIEQLRPNAADHRTARRRLTRELSRLQVAAGTTLWSTTPDLVAVAESVSIESDVGAIVAHSNQPNRSTDRSREAWDLGQLLRRIDAGPFLPGHDSDWVESVRARIAGHEAELRHRLLALLGPVDATESLAHARRLVALNPFDDRAHAAVVRSLRSTRDREAATSYADDVAGLYARELNTADLPQAIRLALTESRSDPPRLHAEIADCRATYSAEGDPNERRNIARRLDTALRAAGRHEARVELLPLLAPWRQAEVLLFRGEPDGAASALEATSDTGTAAHEHPAWTSLTQALFDHMHGRNTQAQKQIEAVLEAELPPALAIEANLRLERVLDALGDVAGSRRCAFTALDLARDSGDVAAHAAALTSLGWSLTRSYRIAEATATLEQALDLAESVGAEAVRAAALCGLGSMAYWGRRHATAAANMQAAAETSRRNGDLAGLVRWLTNEAIPQSTIGNFDRLVDILAELRTMPEGLLTAPARARVIEIELRLALHRGEYDEAFELAQDLAAHFVSTEERVPHLGAQSELIDIHLEVGNGATALKLAYENRARGKELDLDQTWERILEMRVGAALIATGDLEAGVAVLDEAIEHGEPGQILSAPSHVAYHDALIELGRNDEARVVRYSIRHMLEAMRHDLSAEQWKVAVRHAPDVRALLPIAGIDET